MEAEADGALKLHRLLAAFVKAQDLEKLGFLPMPAQQAVEEALLAEANRLNNAGYPAPLLAWQLHLRHITDAASARADETAAGLCNTMGFFLVSVADYAAARPYYEQALAIREKALGADHPATASSLNNLGSLLDSMGDYAAARPYYEQALAIREKRWAPTTPTPPSVSTISATCCLPWATTPPPEDGSLPATDLPGIYEREPVYFYAGDTLGAHEALHVLKSPAVDVCNTIGPTIRIIPALSNEGASLSR